MNKKNILLKCLGTFFILIIVFTVVSQKIYYYNLPEVTIGNTYSGNLGYAYNKKCNLYFDNKSYIVSKCDVYIKEVYCTPGKVIKKNEPIIKLDVENLKKKTDMLNADIKKNNEEINLINDGCSEYDQKILNYKKEIDNNKKLIETKNSEMSTYKLKIENIKAKSIELKQVSNYDIEKSKLNMKNLESKYNDNQVLYNSGALSLYELNESKNAYEDAKLEYDNNLFIYNEDSKNAKEAYESAVKEKNEEIAEYEYKIKEIEKDIKVCEGNIEQAELKLKEISPETINNKLNDLILENNELQDQIKKINDYVSSDGIIYSEMDGIVENINVKELMSYEENEVLAEVNYSKGVIKAKWTMEYIDARAEVGNKVIIEDVNIIDVDNKKNAQNISLSISEKEYDSDLNQYIYNAEINTNEINIDCLNGEEHNISILFSGDEDYDMIIPKSALSSNDNNSGYVYTIEECNMPFGKKGYCVNEEYVTIVDYNDTEVAISNTRLKDKDIVFSTSKQLKDGDKVRFWE